MPRNSVFTSGLSRWLGVVLLVLFSATVRAQVVDDSTRVMYGPKTTRVIFENEVLRDSTSGIPVDTTLTKWPQQRFWVHDTTFQQDLGAVGTASRPLLYQPNLELGARYGRNAFDRYAHNARTVPYYDSRSPYSFFRFIQSGAGEQVFEISYSRSLKKNFSIGVDYERIASNKISFARSSRDALVEHSNLLLFGRFQTDNERYHLLFNISNARHRGVEQGGIRPIINYKTDGATIDTARSELALTDLFKYGQQQVYLTTAINYEDRDELYFTHTYRLLGRGLTVYHTFDYKRQYNSYADLALKTTGDPNFFYPRKLGSQTATIDRSQFSQVENTVGVLGRTSAVEYRLYARDRVASLTSSTLADTATATKLYLQPGAPTRSFHQFFVGGTAAFNYRTIYAIETAGEAYLLPLSGLSSDSYSLEYWLRGRVRTGPLSAEALVNSYSPTLTQQEFIGNHYRWSHWSGDYDNKITHTADGKFSNTSTQQLTGRLQLKLPAVLALRQQRFEASASLVNIKNLVYYNTLGLPAQADVANQLIIVAARHRAQVGRFGLDNQATYTKGGDVNGLRIPALVTESRAYYEAYIFRKALFSQTGLELYSQSAYQAFAYSPSTQQFYQQNAFTIGAYPIVNAFFSADIKTVSVFLKVAYLNQNLGRDGYFATPYYSGYPRRFQFGVRWNFFD
ncbi:putative porin [Hymenobacter sp. DH14]|uniref:Porin n=1 Tax=Hymenobacter cyanobacteriorum TaxID=2926463 RepID=A0A9X1VJC9_9BACT|nr:putative porin [Hymenobacter cyanobacteriorum]MCI1187376.1 putative porin [Hymenobacter cyanobacteriorum]